MNCLPPRLALVGLRGAGKSVCGALVAERLGFPFVDLDDRIAAAAGAAHAGEVIAREGLPAFRVRESAALGAALAEPTRLVLSTGGGAIEDPQSRELLRSRAVTVWLRAPLDVLRGRIARDEEAAGTAVPLRPAIVQGARGGADEPTASDELAILAERRAPWYREVSRRAIDVEGLTPEQISRQLIEIWRG